MSPHESYQPLESVESGPGDTESETVDSVVELPPYTIDSPEWEQPGVLDDDENVQDKIASIMDVYSKVYSVAKMFEVSFVGFEIDVSISTLKPRTTSPNTDYNYRLTTSPRACRTISTALKA